MLDLILVTRLYICVNYLGDFSPAISSITHLLQAEFLLWCPGSVGSALLCRGLCRSACGIVGWRCYSRCCCILCIGGRRNRGRDLANAHGGRYSSVGRRGDCTWCWAFALTIRLSGCWCRSLLLRLRSTRGLLRNIHRRLPWSWVVWLLLLLLLLLWLLWAGCHVWLRCSVRKIHAVIATGHVGLVRMIAMGGILLVLHVHPSWCSFVFEAKASNCCA